MTVKIIEAIEPKGAAVRLLSNPLNGDRIGVDVYRSGTGRGAADYYMDVSGPALRDALLEAFPLEVKDEPKKQAVPGMVFQGPPREGLFTVLPDGRYYDHASGRTFTYDQFASDPSYDLVFDPRDAPALPSPLGIRVGDRVERTKDGITISFEVGHIGDGTSHIFAKGDGPHFPVAYNPKGFEVTSREVPDRLPAGTIVRLTHYGDLRLITDDGGIHLTGFVNAKPDFRDQSDYGRLIKDGEAEVIYLPES